MNQQLTNIGRVKYVSNVYIIDKDIDILLSELRRQKINGIVRLHIHLGGINGIDLEIIDKYNNIQP